jgi:hypothetical protein
MLKLTTPEQIPILTVSTVRGSLKIRRGSEKFLTRIRNYFIQNMRIRSPALVQSMKRYLKNLEEWLLLLHTVRYLIKYARIRIYSYGTRSTLWYRNQFISLKTLQKIPTSRVIKFQLIKSIQNFF